MVVYFVNKHHIKLGFVKVADELNACKSTANNYYFFSFTHGLFLARKSRPLTATQFSIFQFSLSQL